MLSAIAIAFVMASVAGMALMPMWKKNHVDQAYDIAISVVRTYRNLAISQGKRYIITVTQPRTMTVQYWGVAVPPNPAPAPVTVSTYTLPMDVQFLTQAGFPNPGPDGFGTTYFAFNACAVVAGGNPCVIFYPDGSAQDDQGNFNNGVVYISRPADVYSARAIDVWGTTGRVRGWRLYNVGGTNTWEQQ